MRTHLNNTVSHGLIRMMQPTFAPDDGGAAGGIVADPAVKPWYDGADQETVGYFQNRGWDKLDAKSAAFEAAKAHRQAEKFVGAPANELIRVPKDASDVDGWRQLKTRLGAPNEAKDYDFSSIKDAKGSALDEGFASDLREAAFARGLSKDDAAFIADALVKHNDKTSASKAAEFQAKLQEDQNGLKTDWGQAYDANLFVARQTAQKLGVPAEAIAKLEGEVGFRSVMNMFFKIGAATGEHKFIQGGNPDNPVTMGPTQASDAKAQAMRDTAWVKRYMDGGVTEMNQMKAWNAIITGQDWGAQRPA